MGDLVAHMNPQPKAVVSREVGGVKMRIPVDFGHGEKGYVEVGINVTSAPIDVFDKNPVAAFRMRQAVERALTSPISTRYGKGARTAEEVMFADLLTDTIIQKVRDTL